MKTNLLCLWILLCICPASAQTASSQDLLYPRFQEGTAILRNGMQVKGKYNFSTVKREIQFLGENDAVMAFEKPQDVYQVIIGDHTFENTPKNGFLERIAVGSGSYYVEWGNKWISIGKRAGNSRLQSYGINSYKTSAEGTSSYPRFVQDEGMISLPEASYFMKINNKMKHFTSASSLAKTIGCCKNELKEFVRKEKVDFKNPDDIYRMMDTFLSGVSKVSSTPPSFYDFTVETIDGAIFSLSRLKGKKVMVVNVASKCGLTPQYAQLQALYERYKDKNLVIIGFPANNFGAQEPGSNEEIKTFCIANYGVTFPMMAKISVKGDDMDPLYRWLTTKEANGVADAEVTWNFQKFLIDETGQWVKSIEPKESPQSEEIIAWIEK
jgi:glutathione peroxidase